MSVRTRFAPSPTGYLHIGGVRTALFNWLFARQHGGQFLLRIDDTDAERNVAEALQPILRRLQLAGPRLGRRADDDGRGSRGPCGSYFQSQRLDRYQAAVKMLLDEGLRLSRLRHDRGAEGRARGGREGEAGRFSTAAAGWPRPTSRPSKFRGRGPAGRSCG